MQAKSEEKRQGLLGGVQRQSWTLAWLCGKGQKEATEGQQETTEERMESGTLDCQTMRRF